MKNIPEKIYLQTGLEGLDPDIDFNNLSGVTWCIDKLGLNDIEYVLSQHVQSELSKKIEQIKKELNDNKIRPLNPIWVRDQILTRLKEK